MKLGILTFHSAHNYGAVLQAYGLQEYLSRNGHEVYVIDYRPEYISYCYPRDGRAFWMSRNPLTCAKGLYNYYRHKRIRYARWDNFEAFIKRHLHLYPYYQGMDFHEFDAVLIGSDQVWSSVHTGGRFDPVFFGEGFHCKVISYAPSCTNLSLTESDTNFLRKHLDAMTAISVREEKMKDVLQPLTGKNISVVVDPSLLAGRSCFEPIAAPAGPRRPYIVIYEIGYHPEVYRMAKAMAWRIGADIIELTNGMRFCHRSSMHEEATPEDFLGYIKNAACVLTTSFHGTAFSLLFHTPFYTVLQHSDADTRMVALLRAMGMENRLVEMNDVPEMEPFDIKYVDDRLNKLVTGSEVFVQNALMQT